MVRALNGLGCAEAEQEATVILSSRSVSSGAPLSVGHMARVLASAPMVGLRVGSSVVGFPATQNVGPISQYRHRIHQLYM